MTRTCELEESKQASVWEDDQVAFRQWNHYSWQTKPTFFSVFWYPLINQSVDVVGL